MLKKKRVEEGNRYIEERVSLVFLLPYMVSTLKPLLNSFALNKDLFDDTEDWIYEILLAEKSPYLIHFEHTKMVGGCSSFSTPRCIHPNMGARCRGGGVSGQNGFWASGLFGRREGEGCGERER